MTAARRAIATVTIACLALLGAACSGDSDSDGTTTTGAPTTDAPVSDEAYAEEVATAEAAITGAGTDLCALAASSGQLPSTPPTNPAQAEQIVDLAVTLYTALAAVPGLAPEDVATITAGVQQYQAAAQGTGYDPEAIASSEIQEGITNDAFVAAITPIQERAVAECAPVAAPGTETTVPAG